jgi:hypothetical protein
MRPLADDTPYRPRKFRGPGTASPAGNCPASLLPPRHHLTFIEQPYMQRRNDAVLPRTPTVVAPKETCGCFAQHGTIWRSRHSMRLARHLARSLYIPLSLVSIGHFTHSTPPITAPLLNEVGKSTLHHRTQRTATVPKIPYIGIYRILRIYSLSRQPPDPSPTPQLSAPVLTGAWLRLAPSVAASGRSLHRSPPAPGHFPSSLYGEDGGNGRFRAR